jgi:hypothetical protein
MTLFGVAYVSSLNAIVIAAKADIEFDHGSPFWLCSTNPPLKQQFASFKERYEAEDWLIQQGASDIIEGKYVPVLEQYLRNKT